MMVIAPGRNDLICSGTSFIGGRVSASRVLPARRNYNRHTRRREMLLELQISIAGDENVEPLLPHLVQQLTILNTAPAHPLHRRAKMPA